MKLTDFDKLVCLGIDKRINEHYTLRKQFEERNAHLNIFLAGDGLTRPAWEYDRIDTEPPVRRGYPAWAHRPNSWNAFQCFRQIITRAKEEGVQTLGIFEDDCRLLDNFDGVLNAAGKELEELDVKWDMLYLGANHTFSVTKEISPHLLKLNGSGCWHAVILNNEHGSVFDEVLALPANAPIDQMCGQMLHPKLDCYAVWPTVAIQKSGYSHCEGSEQDYSHYWENKGRKVIKCSN